MSKAAVGRKLLYLRAWRERAFLSQRMLADLAGISRYTIMAWERGRYGASYSCIHQVADALCITPQELCEVDPSSRAVVLSRVEEE